MIKTKGVLHVTIPVSDLARSRRFYTDVLGLEFVAEAPKENPHFIFLKSGADYVLLGRDAGRERFSDIIPTMRRGRKSKPGGRAEFWGEKRVKGGLSGVRADSTRV